MERRTFLSAGSASVLALAADFPSVTGAAVSAGPSEVVREYYRRASAAESVNEFADRIPELAHSASPFLDIVTENPRFSEEVLRQELVGIEVIEENVTGEEIRDISDFFAASVTEEEVDTIAETNAVVAVTLETEDVVGGVFGKEWLVAPEDGEWKLVWVDERNSPEAAAREFFREVSLAETLGELDGPVEELSHSVSPLVNVAEYTPWYFRGLRRQELNQTNVVAENINASEIATQFTSFINWASRDDIRSIAERNAVVELSLSDDQLEIDDLTQQLLMAPENGEWRLVWF
jgi:hypothetical protein